MVKRKGNLIRGFKSRAKPKHKMKCTFGVNKNTGKCLKYPRKK